MGAKDSLPDIDLESVEAHCNSSWEHRALKLFSTLK